MSWFSADRPSFRARTDSTDFGEDYTDDRFKPLKRANTEPVKRSLSHFDTDVVVEWDSTDRQWAPLTKMLSFTRDRSDSIAAPGASCVVVVDPFSSGALLAELAVSRGCVVAAAAALCEQRPPAMSYSAPLRYHSS